MPTLLDELTNLTSEAFFKVGKNLFQEDLAPYGTVRISDRPDLAQFQCNGAMAAAKKLGKNPRDLATQIVNELKQYEFFSHVEVAGPGFINLNVSDTALAQALKAMAWDSHDGIPQIGTGQTVILDYGGPNAAKAMHVGHLRTAIVGDTLRRLLIAVGYHAIGDIHLGDDGLQAGMVISELEIRYPNWPYFIPGKKDGFPAQFELDFDSLTDIYPAASASSKADPARMERARRATFDFQQGHPGYNALWQNIIEMSTASMRANYGALNVHFDLWKGENGVAHLIPPMVEDLKKQHFAVESEGAWVIPVAKNDDKREVPPLILIKSDGAYLYATTDLATLIDRMTTNDHPRPTWCIYVVDQRQGLHFDQVFRAAKMSGIAPENLRLDFAGIGTMNGSDGKPFKTRAGGVLRLQDLIQMAIDKARARMDAAQIGLDWDAQEKESVARAVAVAALKFADLKNQRHVDYVFDLDAMTSFEGKTGPYLLYQAVRIKSILAKAAALGMKVEDAYTPDHVGDEALTLALLLTDFPNAVALSASPDNLSAHILADYLYRLAQEFSQFYARCHILNEPDVIKQQSWINLLAITLKTLEKGLGLMGIDVPARM